MSRPHALVTGASAGIGAAIAQRLAGEGFDLVVSAEDSGVHRGIGQLERSGVEITPVRADLRDPGAVEALFAVATADRPLDVLVLNAGIGVGGGDFTETSLAEHLAVVDLNVRSTVHLAGLVVPGMRHRGAGRVLITSSLVAPMAGPYQTTYNASKAFLANFAAGLRYELRNSGVTVTTLLPGPVETGFFARAGMISTVLGRMTKEDPELVARQAVRALLRGRSSVVGGRAISIPAAALISMLPQNARTRLQALLSKPARRG
ncbi:MAG TPA: SDR family NAD(P)-dependent oxidoreductase [Microlunatus sp.]|nr:SDR family NAD(P)-dependent oxidoreductase [Microlunatus sp.]